MSTKRVILANGSRLMREAFRRVIDKADRLEVLPEFPEPQDLPAVIERVEPEWVFFSSPWEGESGPLLNSYLSRYPSVRFVVISPDHNHIELRSQAADGKDLTHLSLDEFLYVLDRDLQHS